MQVDDQTHQQDFTVSNSGYYALKVTASCEHKSDALIKIDGVSFRELPPLRNIQRYNIPASWNGSFLLGKPQTNVYIMYFEEGNHQFRFVYKNSAKLISWNLEKLSNPNQFVLDLNLQANHCERQPVLNIILIDLPLASIGAKIGLQWHKQGFVRGDGDDVKLVADNQIQRDGNKQWLWRATKADKQVRVEERKVLLALDQSLHYLEFWADQSPIIYQVTVQTKPVCADSDYCCHPTVRRVYENKDKAVLGVYIESGNPREINNDNIEVYFGDERLQLGVNTGQAPYKNVFDFSTEIYHEEGSKWFYYGVDTSWRFFHWSWQDASKWRI